MHCLKYVQAPNYIYEERIFTIGIGAVSIGSSLENRRTAIPRHFQTRTRWAQTLIGLGCIRCSPSSGSVLRSTAATPPPAAGRSIQSRSRAASAATLVCKCPDAPTSSKFKKSIQPVMQCSLSPSN
jgi:hypothetical protein